MTTDSLKSIVETGCKSFALGVSLIFQAVAKGEIATMVDAFGKTSILTGDWYCPLNSSLKLCFINNPDRCFDTDILPEGFVEALTAKGLTFDESESKDGWIVITKKGVEYRLVVWYGKYPQ